MNILKNHKPTENVDFINFGRLSCSLFSICNHKAILTCRNLLTIENDLSKICLRRFNRLPIRL